MRRSSEEFITSSGKNLLKIECSWPDNKYPQKIFTYDHLKSFSYMGNGTSSNSMQVGLASICTTSFSIINVVGQWDDINFKGAKLSIFLGRELPSGIEYVKLGKFTVDDSVKNEGIINIESSDNMALFDVRFRGIPFPCTIKQLIEMACFQVGVILETTDFPGLDRLLDTLENVTALTCREILSYALELLGAFGIINSEGNLEIRWFNTNKIDYTLPESHILSCKPGTAQIATGVSGYFDGEELIAGSPESLIHLSDDNVLIRNISFEEKEPIVQAVYTNSIEQMSYTPGSIEARGLCLLEPGDTIQFEHKGRTYKYIVASIKLSGNLRMSITSTAPATSSSASGGTSLSGVSNDSSMKTVYMLSYEETILPITQPYADTKELVSVSITKSEGHVPIAMFTSLFECMGDESEHSQVKFSLMAGQSVIHSFIQRCHKGTNTGNFTWPLVDLPTGASRISVTATTLNSQSNPPVIKWHVGDTSLIVIGRGFNVSSLWNGLISASDTFNNVVVPNNIGSKVKVTQLNSEASVMSQIPHRSGFEDSFEPLVVAPTKVSKVGVAGITETHTIEL